MAEVILLKLFLNCTLKTLQEEKIQIEKGFCWLLISFCSIIPLAICLSHPLTLLLYCLWLFSLLMLVFPMPVLNILLFSPLPFLKEHLFWIYWSYLCNDSTKNTQRSLCNQNLSQNADVEINLEAVEAFF